MMKYIIHKTLGERISTLDDITNIQRKLDYTSITGDTKM
jgi:hypothetical protein